MGLTGSKRRCACWDSSPQNVLFRCWTSWFFSTFLIFCTTCLASSPESSSSVAQLPRILTHSSPSPGFPRFALFAQEFSSSNAGFLASFHLFCTFTLIFVGFPRMNLPRWLWTDQFREASTQAHAHTCTHSHTMVPTESIKNANSDPQTFCL